MTANPVTDPEAQDEVTELCAELVRIDTTNYGAGKSVGELQAAEYVVERLAEVGIDSVLLESAPGRANVIARIPGTDPTLPGLLVHGHLDVVPAVRADWQVDPFGGEIRDGMLWGRGTIDMKGACATTLATVRAMARSGVRPRRDVVLAFMADEEDNGEYGAKWLVEHHPALFAGVTAAVSESGGFTLHASGPAGPARIYPIAVGERGSAWMRLTARGTAGHASKVNPDNAVLHLVAALTRLGQNDWPLRVPYPCSTTCSGPVTCSASRSTWPTRQTAVARLGAAGRLVSATLRCSTAPTMIEAGYKVNVVPGTATAYVDGRVVPGCEDEFEAEVDRLIGPQVTREYVGHDSPIVTDWGNPVTDAIAASVLEEDPGATVLPFVMSGGTDAKSFAKLGIAGYGFAPIQLGPGLDYYTMAHGVDERVPVDGLRFGARVFERFLTNC